MLDMLGHAWQVSNMVENIFNDNSCLYIIGTQLYSHNTIINNKSILKINTYKHEIG